MSALQLQNGQPPSCGFDYEQMETLIAVTRDNGGKLDHLASEMGTISKQQKEVVRFLLIVVCVIALGKSALDAIEKVAAAWTGVGVTQGAVER